ncbi:hypothetical protein PGT21_031426 [Puccinia graminis f. sp. tritici]|uniref:Uncharacterized protein n=1 Tax=Puccinia graminis f. sp. tritici TaxID=56615 RepID=A0A5B0P014_PUCGR|nr:hypothetical protein PGTUg99_010580 [Puccinia graminis f. sp. tritici]KAA1094851.1 hypothetical protein PGT21_031426 [Puccinia graminis f. sp. tritici]
MLFNALNFILLCAAGLQLSVGGSGLASKDEALDNRSKSSRGAIRRRILDGGSTQVDDDGSNLFLQGWSSLVPEISSCRSTFEQNAPVEVAIQAAASLASKIQAISFQYGQCGCNHQILGNQTISEFRTLLVQFFLGLGFVLKAGLQHYQDAWCSTFKPIFRQCAAAFISLRAIADALKLDLEAILGQVNLDPVVFLTVDLNMSNLLGINISLGETLHL